MQKRDMRKYLWDYYGKRYVHCLTALKSFITNDAVLYNLLGKTCLSRDVGSVRVLENFFFLLQFFNLPANFYDKLNNFIRFVISDPTLTTE